MHSPATDTLTIAPLQSPGGVALSLVIPTYNESQNIADLLRALHAALEGNIENYEIIVVDDDSRDGTWKIASEIASRDPRLRVLRRVGERGLATAVIRGWQIARGEVLGVIDGDLQHPPELVPQLWGEIEEGADIAVASRRVDGGGLGDWSIWRRLFSRAAQFLGLLLLPGVLSKVSDPMSGYFMVRRRVLQGLPLSPRGYKILVEILGRSRPLHIAEVGYVFRVRERGTSKATLRISWEYLLHLLQLRFLPTPAAAASAGAMAGNYASFDPSDGAVKKASKASAGAR